jgi:histidine triad (HIT) family protein
MEKDCIFCKIISGEIPTHFIYEDEVVVAFPDIHPVAPGHTLLIPKEHHQWFYDVPDTISDTWFSAAKQLAHRLKDEHNADYVRLSIVGKDVPHAHIHLIPEKL